RPAGAVRADRGADDLELEPAGREPADVDAGADHAVPAERGALGLHPADRLVPGLVHGPDQRAEGPGAAGSGHRRDTAVRRREPAPAGPGTRARVADVADVVDRGAEDLANRLEADAADRGELVGGQRRAPGAAGPDLGHPLLRRRRKLLLAHRTSLPSQRPR